MQPFGNEMEYLKPSNRLHHNFKHMLVGVQKFIQLTRDIDLEFKPVTTFVFFNFKINWKIVGGGYCI